MEEILFGLTVGLASGLNPGPLLTLVITATLQRGFAAGLRVAVAPILTDAPIIAVCLFVLRELSDAWQAGIGLVGGGVVIFFAARIWAESRRAELPTAADADATPAKDIWQGAAVNLLNPNAWLFWSAVGTPLILRVWNDRPWAAAGFVGGFFLLLVGTKILLAALLARGRNFLSLTVYRRAMAACSLALFLLGLLLAYRAFGTLGLVGSQRLGG